MIETEPASSAAAVVEDWFGIPESVEDDPVARIAERTGLTRAEVEAAIERLRKSGRA